MTSGGSSADAEKCLLHLIAAQDPLLCAAQNLPSGLLEILNIHPVHVSSSNKPTGTVRAKESRKEETQRTNRMDSTCRGAPQINSHRDKRHNSVIKGWGDERAGFVVCGCETLRMMFEHACLCMRVCARVCV